LLNKLSFVVSTTLLYSWIRDARIYPIIVQDIDARGRHSSHQFTIIPTLISFTIVSILQLLTLLFGIFSISCNISWLEQRENCSLFRIKPFRKKCLVEKNFLLEKKQLCFSHYGQCMHVMLYVMTLNFEVYVVLHKFFFL
jgi:hypothetical protein